MLLNGGGRDSAAAAAAIAYERHRIGVCRAHGLRWKRLVSRLVLGMNNFVLFYQPYHGHIVRAVATLVAAVPVSMQKQMLLQIAVIICSVRTALTEVGLLFNHAAIK